MTCCQSSFPAYPCQPAWGNNWIPFDLRCYINLSTSNPNISKLQSKQAEQTGRDAQIFEAIFPISQRENSYGPLGLTHSSLRLQLFSWRVSWRHDSMLCQSVPGAVVSQFSFRVIGWGQHEKGCGPESILKVTSWFSSSRSRNLGGEVGMMFSSLWPWIVLSAYLLPDVYFPNLRNILKRSFYPVKADDVFLGHPAILIPG